MAASSSATAATASSGPSRRRCGRPRPSDWACRRRIRARLGRGRRRALAVSPAVPREGWALRWDDVTFHRAVHAVPPSRLLPRHGPGVGLDGRRGWRRVRRRRNALNLFGYTGVGSSRARAERRRSPMSMPRRNRSTQARANAALSGMADRPSAGSSTMPPNSPRARCGAGGAMTGSSSIRPNSGAGRKARSGGWRNDLPRR